MFPSGKKIFKRSGLWFSAVLLIPFSLGFQLSDDTHALAQQTQARLNESFDEEQIAYRLKKHEISLTDNGFLRFRKIMQTGKQEYFSFNMLRFADLDYLGTRSRGTLILRTRDKDVIVQTYNDPRGNIDSMTNEILIPLKNIEPEDLQQIQSNLLQIRKQLQDN